MILHQDAFIIVSGCLFIYLVKLISEQLRARFSPLDLSRVIVAQYQCFWFSWMRKTEKKHSKWRKCFGHSGYVCDFRPSLQQQQQKKPRWGLRASCSGYRLSEASDPATAGLSEVTQAKSEHKRLFLPAPPLKLASIKSSAGSLGLKMAISSKHLRPETIKTRPRAAHRQLLSPEMLHMQLITQRNL